MGNLFLSIVAVLFLLFGSLLNNASKFKQPKLYSPCTPPIHYKLGAIDKRFNLTDQKILDDVGKATDIWKDSLGREVFIYDEDGIVTKKERLITINFVYDDRQRLNSQIKQIEGKVKNENKSVQTSIADYKARVVSFNQKSEGWSQKLKELDIHDPNYNLKFDEIYKESQDLNKEVEELNQIAKDLNQSTDAYNSEIVKLNGTISRFNAALTDKPEEGVYNSGGDFIEIYITNSNTELIHTLAHEFGHSLGISHIENREAIMYPNTNDRIKATGEDMAAIKEACKERERK